ncbi:MULTISPECIES: TlyA family RNA methyltransferase [Clostridium]|jgi:23S rRNA (cytidine1920-2'-O)/16S rRNA (cytidine1409-2'-O)-methyltransferase|uniref:TlyA family RNA methyltransferase n=1 Tax=Clostridium TaxID=1485 RepID=UPI00028925E2|nr:MULTISPECIES: TlyA family RNA methyltransferase [Clostridium]MDF2503334.1 hemolysin [Clostridium sp.]
MAEAKERLDVLLVKKGIFQSRERARASIMAGEIFIDDVRYDKCGEKVKETSNIIFKGKTMPYVSRGGYKLEKAIKSFQINLKDKTCFDIGASTGGFTDCMLQNGAKKVFSIDVGYGQFAWKLRNDPRVVCMERTNVRYVKEKDIGEIGDFASIDVSFISLKKVIPVLLDLLVDDGEIVALIKPQFEAGREKVGKKGVVRDPEVHKEVINGIVNFLIENNLNIIGIDHSPIKGPEGNIEYLIYFNKNNNIHSDFSLDNIELVVKKAHGQLD